MAAQEVDVLIVGAGPAGLTAAATLRRYGVNVLVIERKQEILGMPRATVVSTRSMELFRSWGLEDQIHAGGAQVEWRGLVTETLADAGAGEPMELGLPSREQAAALSPVMPACAPQDHTEAVLLQHVRALGGDVRFGQEVFRVEIGDDGVEALIQDGERTHVVKAQYLIGADGARSTVRSALGIPMRGADGMHRSVTLCSPRRSGSGWASCATGSTRSCIRTLPASSSRPVVGTSGSTAPTPFSPSSATTRPR